MYVVEIEDHETGEKGYKAFMLSTGAVDYWSTVSVLRDDDLRSLPKIFKAKTNDVVLAIALTKAGEAEFFDFGGLHAKLKEVDDRVMLLEGDLSEEQIEVEAAKIVDSTKLAENPAIFALARKRVEQDATSKKKPRR